MASTHGWTSAFLMVALASGVYGHSYTAVPRWGQASAILYDKLLISGGKTDPQHQFTYTSAPNSNDLLSLDLSISFALSSPPWSYISGSQNGTTSQGPAVAFHTLTPYTSSELLVFGGDAGFSSIQTNADSAFLLNAEDLTSPSWSSQTAGWASEPIRRVYHTAPSASGAIYIIGGEKADGSQIGTPDAYLFNAVANSGSPAFIPLTSTTNAPAGLVGHAAHVLPGGTLLVFGGFFSSGSTPNTPSPLSIIYTLDTTSASPTWSIQNATGGTVPIPRRGFASAMLTNGKILIHGGADAALETLYSDGAILDTTQTPMVWSPVDGLSETLGPRVGHFAAPINGQVLFGFGWGGNAAASANIALYDPTSSTFQPTYTPPPTLVSITTLPVSPTSPGGTYPSSGANTGQGGQGGSGSSTHSGMGSSPSSGSGSGQGGGGGQGGSFSNRSITGIIVGSILGFLASVGLVGGGMYYFLRWRVRRAWGFDSNISQNAEGRWRLMPEEDLRDASLDEYSNQPGPMVQMAGTRWHQPRPGWGLLGLGALIGVGGTYGTTGRRRFDMLADEDARRFDVDSVLHEGEADTWRYHNARSRRGRTHRQGTGGSSMSIESRETNTGNFAWNDVWNASVSSLRNVGATLGVTATGLAAARESNGGSANTKAWLEKDALPLNPFQDPVPTIQEGSVLMEINPLVASMDGEAHLGRNKSNASSRASVKPHVDPFVDPHEGEARMGDVKAEDTTSLLSDIPSVGSGGRHSSQSSLPRTFAMMGIARSGDTSPGYYDQGGSASVESHEAPSSRSTQSTSLTGTGVTSSSADYSSISSPTSPRTTSIIGATITPNIPMRRSDSWWSRFSRTSFLDRHSSSDVSNRNGVNGGLADFRDPNPAPRLGQLGAIQESRQPTEDSNHPDASPEGDGPSKADPRKSGSADAASTKSSIKTANSVLIEGIDGRMEVVQRALSLTSRATSSPAATFDGHDDSHKWGPSSSDHIHRRSWLTASDAETESPVAESPTETINPVDRLPTDTRPDVSSYVQPPSDGSSSSTGAGEQQGHRPRRTLTGAVAARVSAYEQRLSQDSLTQTPPFDIKPGLKTEQSRRGRVGYGLVPKAPLFVANPDRRTQGSS
ncbi:hypothetical protein JB92DRAFT_3112291 [Gautieria morchelliformis]|nr:hypothetical protein JB92DRAFT_3112291 [Gautieria morchelliformis]